MSTPHGIKRALIVEDDQSSRSVMSEVCSSLNMDVHEAERGDEGLRLIEGNDYSLLLSDYMMPGIDGIELVEKARLLRPEIPIILITAYATVDRAVRAMTAGADHVLEKPIKPSALRDVVQEIIARKTKCFRETQSGAYETFNADWQPVYQPLSGADAAPGATHRASLRDNLHGSHHGRKRHGKRTRRARHSRALSAKLWSLCPGQLWRYPRNAP